MALTTPNPNFNSNCNTTFNFTSNSNPNPNTLPFQLICNDLWPLKLRPYGVLQIYVLLLLFILSVVNW